MKMSFNKHNMVFLTRYTAFDIFILRNIIPYGLNEIDYSKVDHNVH